MPEGNDKDRFLDQAEEELGEYLEERGRVSRFLLIQKGSEFQRDAWRQLSSIPYGETISYGEQARRSGGILKRCVRWERRSGANPLSIIIPCHRVIGQKRYLDVGLGEVWTERKNY